MRDAIIASKMSLQSYLPAASKAAKTGRLHARQDVFDYIEMFYNPQRKHVRNGMLSPVEFETRQKLKPQSV